MPQNHNRKRMTASEQIFSKHPHGTQPYTHTLDGMVSNMIYAAAVTACILFWVNHARVKQATSRARFMEISFLLLQRVPLPKRPSICNILLLSLDQRVAASLCKVQSCFPYPYPLSHTHVRARKPQTTMPVAATAKSNNLHQQSAPECRERCRKICISLRLRDVWKRTPLPPLSLLGWSHTHIHTYTQLPNGDHYWQPQANVSDCFTPNWFRGERIGAKRVTRRDEPVSWCVWVGASEVELIGNWTRECKSIP